MVIKPITLKAASEYVNRNHRHHKAPIGHKFSVGLYDDETLVGVGIAGRPVAKAFDNGTTLEITRVCTDGSHNACSMIYSALRKAASAMGYTRIITYTLMSENGASLRASGFVCTGENVGGTHWTGERSRSFADNPTELKKRWEWKNNSKT